ncbi:mechanosensitive ion channel protein [Chloropicon primus]|uniref:Mechanosensitive ion channel protein n=1 Tax=Chloropicon primus TaxID=1764295 RepID=A0A5B8MJ63_9CHLO|nr:mechanosensitive ion channel protein [Chloropicon primus]|eukprot:QDZ19430.1 mechanosensitive ion channel protein [Chloropicon primus]
MEAEEVRMLLQLAYDSEAEAGTKAAKAKGRMLERRQKQVAEERKLRMSRASNQQQRGQPSSPVTVKQKLRARDVVTRLSTVVLFLLLGLQLFTHEKAVAANLNSHEFCCYLILLLLLNVPVGAPILLVPLRVLHKHSPKIVERLLTHNPLPGYQPSYKESIYKGLERGVQTGLISMTLVRILQKAGFSSKLYKVITGKNGCLLREMNAVEVAWIVSLSILVLKLVNVLFAALNVMNKNNNAGSKQLRTTSFLRRSRNFLRLTVTVLTSLFFAEAIGLPLKPIWTSLGFLTIAFGLASQEIAKNFLGGMNMLFLKPFEVGDLIQVHGVHGVVTDIGLIHSRVRGRENEVISTPNATFTNSTLVNYSTRKTRVLRMTFGLYAKNIDQLLKISRMIRESLESNPKIDTTHQPPRCHLKDISLRCFEVELYAVVLASSTSEFAVEREKILAQVYTLVNDSGAEFSFENLELNNIISRRSNKP